MGFRWRTVFWMACLNSSPLTFRPALPQTKHCCVFDSASFYWSAHSLDASRPMCRPSSQSSQQRFQRTYCLPDGNHPCPFGQEYAIGPEVRCERAGSGGLSQSWFRNGPRVGRWFRKKLPTNGGALVGRLLGLQLRFFEVALE